MRHTISKTLVALCLVVLVALLPRPTNAQASPEDLVAALRQGGKVVFLRHAMTNASEIDTGRLDDRAGQRNLSADGIVQAAAIGDAIRRLDISFDRILASPVYRARDTAEIAFGSENIEVTMELVADEYAGPQLQFMIDSTTRLLTAAPTPHGTNILLVGHRTPLQIVTGMGFPDSIFPEGAMAVFEPEGAKARLLGTLSSEQLVSMAAAAAPR